MKYCIFIPSPFQWKLGNVPLSLRRELKQKTDIRVLPTTTTTCPRYVCVPAKYVILVVLDDTDGMRPTVTSEVERLGREPVPAASVQQRRAGCGRGQ